MSPSPLPLLAMASIAGVASSAGEGVVVAASIVGSAAVIGKMIAARVDNTAKKVDDLTIKVARIEAIMERESK